MRLAGFAARVWRMFQPCFRAVAMTDRMRAKVRAPAMVRKQPEIFILTFIIRKSPLGLVVGEGHGEVIEESQDIAFELVQPDQKIVSGAMGRPSVRSDLSGEGRQVSMEGKPAPGPRALRPGDGVVAFDQGARERVSAATPPLRRSRRGHFRWPRGEDRAFARPIAPCRCR